MDQSHAQRLRDQERVAYIEGRTAEAKLLSDILDATGAAGHRQSSAGVLTTRPSSAWVDSHR